VYLQKYIYGEQKSYTSADSTYGCVNLGKLENSNRNMATLATAYTTLVIAADEMPNYGCKRALTIEFLFVLFVITRIRRVFWEHMISLTLYTLSADRFI
jgi:hypothetical protein